TDSVRGAGIFKTTNGGTVWTQVTATNNSSFYYVNKIVYSQTADVVYAATNTGVWRSTDGGTNWTKIKAYSQTNGGGCLDLAIRPHVGTQATLFASCGSFVQGHVSQTTDAEAATPAWSDFAPAGAGRISLAVATSNPQTVYALAADNVDQFSSGA